MFVGDSAVTSRLTPAETNSYLTSLACCFENGPPDRRSEPRYITDTPAIVTALMPSRASGVPGRVVDVGRNGIRMRISRPLDVGSMVEVSTESVEIIGRVIWSKNTQIGLQIEDIRVRRPVA